MATLLPGLIFIGSVGNYCAYKLQGSDKIVLRSKGGPSREQVKNGKQFERTRENNSEFGGRSKGAAQVKRALHPLCSVADHNINGALQRVMTLIQKQDMISQRGERNILFSQAGALLNGYQLNRRHLLESLITSPLTIQLNKNELHATLDLPTLVPGVNLLLAKQYTMFRVTMVVGLLSDMMYDPKDYTPVADLTNLSPIHTCSDWYPVQSGAPPIKLELELTSAVPDPDFTIVVSAGVQVGKPANGSVEVMKYCGAGKILVAE